MELGRISLRHRHARCASQSAGGTSGRQKNELRRVAGRRPAVFFDRDGTLIESIHYLNRAEQVRLKPDAADMLARLHTAGFQQVVVTNQSAIGRGLLSEEGLAEVHDAMTDQLSRKGAWVDAIYHCPSRRWVRIGESDRASGSQAGTGNVAAGGGGSSISTWPGRGWSAIWSATSWQESMRAAAARS